MSDAASMVFARWRVLTGARWSKLDGACKITRLILPYNPDQKKLQDHPNIEAEVRLVSRSHNNGPKRGSVGEGLFEVCFNLCYMRFHHTK